MLVEVRVREKIKNVYAGAGTGTKLSAGAVSAPATALRGLVTTANI